MLITHPKIIPFPPPKHYAVHGGIWESFKSAELQVALKQFRMRSEDECPPLLKLGGIYINQK